MPDLLRKRAPSLVREPGPSLLTLTHTLSDIFTHSSYSSEVCGFVLVALLHPPLKQLTIRYKSHIMLHQMKVNVILMTPIMRLSLWRYGCHTVLASRRPVRSCGPAACHTPGNWFKQCLKNRNKYLNNMQGSNPPDTA